MTTTEWIWIIVGIIAVLIIGGLVVWGLSYLAREQRRIRSQRRPDYRPPCAASDAGIDWSGRTATSHETSGPRHIQWGEVQELDAAASTNNATNNDDRVKCPICRLKIDNAAQQITCPKCNTPYHRHCLAEMGYVCSNCKEAIH